MRASQTLNSKKTWQKEGITQLCHISPWQWNEIKYGIGKKTTATTKKNTHHNPSQSHNRHISSYLFDSALPYSSLLPGMLALHLPVLPLVWFCSTFLANGWKRETIFLGFCLCILKHSLITENSNPKCTCIFLFKPQLKNNSVLLRGAKAPCMCFTLLVPMWSSSHALWST